MARIKVKDLPEDQTVTTKEMAQVKGGLLSSKFKLYSPVIQGPGIKGAAAPGPPSPPGGDPPEWDQWGRYS